MEKSTTTTREDSSQTSPGRDAAIAQDARRPVPTASVRPGPTAGPTAPPVPSADWDPLGGRSGVAAGWVGALAGVIGIGVAILVWRRPRPATAVEKGLPLVPVPQPVVTIRKEEFPELFAALAGAPSGTPALVLFSPEVPGSFQYAKAIIALLEADGRAVRKGHGQKLAQNVHVRLDSEEVRITVGSPPPAGARHNVTVG
jgi:hypothetical protein